MLKMIKAILKTMGEALTLAHAGEMLSNDQKTATLNKSKTPIRAAHDMASPRVVLAGDEEMTLDSVERAIELCHEKNAMLDLLCVSTENDNKGINLNNVLGRLGADTYLDFQVIRRHGDLLSVTHAYTHTRPDILMVVVNISDRLRSSAAPLRHREQWFRSTGFLMIELNGGEIN